MEKRIICALLLCASSLAMMSRASAVPVMIDFTDARWSGASGSDSYSQTYDSVDVGLSSTSGALTFNAGGPDADLSPFALDGDGIGIGDDEISWLGGQSLDVTFSSGVTVLGYYLLDLFTGEGPEGHGELAQASFAGGLETTLLDVGTATDKVGYYAREGLDVVGTTMISFSAATLQGYANLSGFSDFALAGILVDFEPVPVPEPGTLGLLGMALAGLALARRRRQEQQAESS